MRPKTQRRIGRVLSPLFLLVLRTYGRLTGQQRARVLVWNEEGELLLIWEIIGTNRWSIPGGGIKRHELPIEAAARELHEETGVDVPLSALRTVAFFGAHETAAGYDAHIFTTTIKKSELLMSKRDAREVLEWRWVRPENLPEKLSPFVRPSLEKLSKQA